MNTRQHLSLVKVNYTIIQDLELFERLEIMYNYIW